MHPIPRKTTPHVLTYIILGGLLLGLLVSWQWNRATGVQKTAGLPNQSADRSATPVYFFSVPAQPTEETLTINLGAPAVGTIAPDFVLFDVNANPFRLSELRGSVVVINFWASWCDPCREEMPILQDLYERYSMDGLIILGVNTTYTDSWEDAVSFAKELGLTFPILFDDTGAVGETLYKVFGLPTSYWIDRDGVIRSFQLGALTEDQMLVILSSLLEL
jgi:thiol-disulfide isomerase/thioredoxin